MSARAMSPARAPRSGARTDPARRARAARSNESGRRSPLARLRAAFTVYSWVTACLLSGLTFVFVLRSAGPLRPHILVANGLTTACAVALGLLFVGLYVRPLLREEEAALRERDTELARAQATTRRKSELLAHVSDEIRTPMSGVFGMSELLLETELTPRQHRYASTVQSSAGALLSLLNDLRDLSKIEAGKLEIVATDCDVRRTVEEVADRAAAGRGHKRLNVTVHVSKSVPALVRCDRERLRQVLTHLAGNAVKFTERGEVVLSVEVITTDSATAQLRFSVQDTGIGIPRFFQNRLFEAFSEVSGSPPGRRGGAGLGLAISRQLVRMMGGEIGVESEVGVGSRFWFTLPVEVSSPRRVVENPPAQKRAEPGDATRARTRQRAGLETVRLRRSSALDPATKRSAVVAEMFLRLVPSQVDAIAAASGEEHGSSVSHGAHRLKGSCLSVGAVAMARVCGELVAEPERSEELVGELREHFEAVKAELEYELARRETSGGSLVVHAGSRPS